MATPGTPAPEDASTWRTILLTAGFVGVVVVATGVGVGSTVLPTVGSVVLALAICGGVGLSLLSTRILLRHLEP